MWKPACHSIQVLILTAAAVQAQDAAGEPFQLLATAGQNALNYTARLPDFICTQTVRRFQAIGPTAPFYKSDSLTIQVSFFQFHENYKLVGRNDRPSRQKMESVGGAISQGEFGSTLLLIFHPKSLADFSFKEWSTLRDRRVAVYRYTVERTNSRYELKVATLSAVAGYHGEVYIDPVTRSVIRVVEILDIPPGLPVQYSNNTIDYDFVDVSGHQYLLPVHCEAESGDFPGRIRDGQVTPTPLAMMKQTRYRNVSDFVDYRKYAAESTVTFEPAK